MPSTEDNNKAVVPDETLTGTEVQPVPDELKWKTMAGSLTDDRDGTFTNATDELRRWADQAHQNVADEPSELDVAAFVKAQAAYIRQQTLFMTAGNAPSQQEAYMRVVRFSRAQGDFIEACLNVLHQLDVV